MSSTPPWIKRGKQGPPKALSGSRTNNDNRKIYNRTRWRKVSKEGRIKDNVCKKCDKIHVDYQGLARDHIIPINQKGAIWDERNHQSLCKHPCHDRKSGHDQKKYKGPSTIIDDPLNEDYKRKIPI